MPVVAFRDGEFSPLSEMTVGIETTALHYGTNVFEGIRAYWNADIEELYVFRAQDHFKRLHASASIYGMSLPYTVDELCSITRDLLTRNEVREGVYIRPILFKSDASIVCWNEGLKDSFVIYNKPFKMFSGGLKCCVSLWRQVDGNAAPVRAKVGGMYAARALARHEALMLGYDEAIMLTSEGKVAEGTGENLFLIEDGKLIAPGSGEDLLAGITRASVIELASELGMEVVERSVNRGELYVADELFMCGTGAEVTPVTAVDGRNVGDGEIGPLTTAMRELYLDVVHGRKDAHMKWLFPVYGRVQ
jgi:branched-chain amino acid aminotransferase